MWHNSILLSRSSWKNSQHEARKASIFPDEIEALSIAEAHP
jgi:hypothetical protein